MEHSTTLSKDDVSRLKQFHDLHFPGQNAPRLEQSVTADNTSLPSERTNGEDDLGYYADGVKRTLTDDQVAMFRNSEIQRLIQERRRITEEEAMRKEEEQNRQEPGEAQHGGKRTWTKHLDEARPSVETLTYDDEPIAVQQPGGRSQTFLWPKLG